MKTCTSASFIPLCHCDFYIVILYIYFYIRDEISFHVQMKGHFMLADACLNKQICDSKAILDWMWKTTHALPLGE